MTEDMEKRTIIYNLEKFCDIFFKHYDVSPKGKYPPHLNRAEELIEEITANDVELLSNHGILIRTPNWINFRIYFESIPHLSAEFLFNEKTPGNLEELERLADGPTCVFEDVILGDEAEIRLEYLRGKLTEEEYLNKFSPRKVI